MMEMQNKIGVVVLEPDLGLLNTLCSLAAQVWGSDEVLPRQTACEFASVIEHLHVGLVLVRASYQRSSPSIQETVADLYAMGTQIVFIEDTPFKLSAGHWLGLGGLYFLSDQACEQQLKELLRFALVRHCIPSASVLG